MKPEKLFINNTHKFPHLREQWDDEANIRSGIDINTISSYSDKKVSWICPTGHKYEAVMKNRTRAGYECNKCREEANLFINDVKHKFTHLLQEWDKEDNIRREIDIDTICSYSRTKVSWICPNGHAYQAVICNRTKQDSGCKQCASDSLRVHDKDVVDKVRNSSNNGVNLTKIGDDSEKFIRDLLIDTHMYQEVEKLGEYGGSADIKIQHWDESTNFIQVKTMTEVKDNVGFVINNDKKYEDDMLMVLVDKKREKFAVMFYRDIKHLQMVKLNYTPHGKYKDFLYTDVELFTVKLTELIPLSSTINTMASTHKKEYESLNRLAVFCKDNQLSYKRNESNGDAVDGFINNYTFQAKFRSVNEKKSETYVISCCKSAGYIGKKRIGKPYEIGDFDFLVVELGGTTTEPDKYKGSFFIIPTQALIERGIMKTDTCAGKRCFCICPPDYVKPHWSKPFWDNTEVIKLLKD